MFMFQVKLFMQLTFWSLLSITLSFTLSFVYILQCGQKDDSFALGPIEWSGKQALIRKQILWIKSKFEMLHLVSICWKKLIFSRAEESFRVSLIPKLLLSFKPTKKGSFTCIISAFNFSTFSQHKDSNLTTIYATICSHDINDN